MKNKPVGLLEARDLDEQVARVLRELSAEPPLRLELVRDLLKLDRQYFSSTDTNYLRETVSRLRRAGQQVIMRPTLLLEAVRSAHLSALWLPDKRRILIDTEIPNLKKRWAEGHEVGHSLAEWHRDYLFGDDLHTLSAQCHETLENEANYVAGRLLFLQDRFVVEAQDREPTMDTVRKLAKTFGNTQTCTLWRLAEEAHRDKPLVGIVCGHPHHPGDDFDPQNPCKYVVESDSFRTQFSTTVSEIDLYNLIRRYCSGRTN